MSEHENNNKKGRIIFLEHYLLDHSDSDNPVTTEALLKAYEEHGLSAHRNTIRDDLETLKEEGIQIESKRVGNGKGHYIAERPFEFTELLALIDAVSSSQFISASKSKILIRKLAAMAIEKDRKELTATAYAADRIKTGSQVAFSALGTASRAVRRGKKLCFQYIDYLPTKEEILRHDGKIYTVSPYALVWSDGRYYVPSYDEEKDAIVPYRIDRMREVRISGQQADLRLPFDLNEYCRSTVLMYGGNKPEEDVTLIAENYTLLYLIDHFGEDIQTEIVDEKHIRVVLHVAPSHTFFSWIFQFDGAIRIIGPEHVKVDYEAMLLKALNEQLQGAESGKVVETVSEDSAGESEESQVTVSDESDKLSQCES